MDIIVNKSSNLYFSNGNVSKTATNSLPITKISISTFQIDPLKKNASFTLSFWTSNVPDDNSIFLGQKVYNYNSTYTVPIKNPSIFSVTSYPTQLYTITIRDKNNNNNNICKFQSQFPYYDTNSPLSVYYDPNTPWQFTGPTGQGPRELSFSKIDKYTTSSDINNIDVWYTTPNGIQYLRTNVAQTGLIPKGTIKFIYSTDPQSITGGSVTTDPLHPYQFNMPSEYYVRSELQTNSQSSSTIKLNKYTNAIKTSNIPLIGPSGLQGNFVNGVNFYLITGPTGTTGTYSSAKFLDYTLYTGYTGLQHGDENKNTVYYTGYTGTTGYKIDNLQYIPNIQNTTVIIPYVIVSDISDPTLQYYSNPLNSVDIGIMDPSSHMYNNILLMLQSTGPTGSFINTILNDSLGLSGTSTIGMSGSSIFISILTNTPVTDPTNTPVTGPTNTPVTGPTITPGTDLTNMPVTNPTNTELFNPNGTNGTIGTIGTIGTTGTTFIRFLTVTGVSPVSGLITGGTLLTITGTGFTDVTAVSIGGALATIITFTDTSISATTPVGSVGTVSVNVTTADGGTSENNLFYTYLQPILSMV